MAWYPNFQWTYYLSRKKIIAYLSPHAVTSLNSLIALIWAGLSCVYTSLKKKCQCLFKSPVIVSVVGSEWRREGGDGGQTPYPCSDHVFDAGTQQALIPVL